LGITAISGCQISSQKSSQSCKEQFSPHGGDNPLKINIYGLPRSHCRRAPGQSEFVFSGTQIGGIIPGMIKTAPPALSVDNF
jgi:hypothetical protein